jgi:hypothetical protein
MPQRRPKRSLWPEMEVRLKRHGGPVMAKVKKPAQDGKTVRRSRYNPVHETRGNTTKGTANKRHKSKTHNNEISIFNLLPHNKTQSIYIIRFIYTSHASSGRVILISREHFWGRGSSEASTSSLRGLHRYDTKLSFTGRH